MQINGSIVLYNNDVELLKKAINSFLNTELEVKLYLIDNSPTDNLKYLSSIDPRIEYIFNDANLGFGKAHNVAIRKSIENEVKYHLVLNPDVYFEKSVLEELCGYMQSHHDVANIIPKTFYPDGRLQYLCKLLPTPAGLVVRRFISSDKLIKKVNKKYELRDFNYDKILNTPFLSGCFMFLRVECLKEVGLFDENIFMYMEDIDLNRRLHKKYKTIFYPNVSIVHVHAQESYKRKALLMSHVKSAVYYFNKWGWFFDGFRKNKNKEVIRLIKKINKKL
ncbi:glycosyltransferase family 2 protein [Campylobacter sp. RM13119]|uniref:glycosyltransferase family 2 protein n=1 Tax=Campylobacter californiensis TaxID=1032243 RepID=UPI0014760E5D|nr:glycosyltransferase family 2 protein [Campylobacter sp. RM13119]MBE3605342.1 glycosyltransferase family 2 protein [Campylobacter sp. RM13119]